MYIYIYIYIRTFIYLYIFMIWYLFIFIYNIYCIHLYSKYKHANHWKSWYNPQGYLKQLSTGYAKDGPFGILQNSGHSHMGVRFRFAQKVRQDGDLILGTWTQNKKYRQNQNVDPKQMFFSKGNIKKTCNMIKTNLRNFIPGCGKTHGKSRTFIYIHGRIFHIELLASSFINFLDALAFTCDSRRKTDRWLIHCRNRKWIIKRDVGIGSSI